jgi:hypothetical protein
MEDLASLRTGSERGRRVTRGARTVQQRRILFGATAALALLAAGGCTEFDRLADYAFPPAVPGLPTGANWVSLPIGGWVTEGGIEAKAIAACFSPNCPAPAGVGLFRAEGREAALLQAVIADPSLLRRQLEANDRRDASPQRRRIRTEIAVERFGEAPLSGFALQLARPDGSHAAHAVVLATSGPGPVSVLIVIGKTAEEVRRIARDVAGRLT